MAGIKQPIQDVLARLATLQVIDQNNATVNLYSRVWNNQIKYEEEGKTYNFPLPASFIEITNPATYNRLGNGMAESDLVWRIHLAHEMLDAGDDVSMDQDLGIFDLRDKVLALLVNYRPTACSNLVFLHEEQEYDHRNLYHYIIDFTCSYIDSKGSQYDADRTDFVESTPPQTLVLNPITTSVGTDLQTQAAKGLTFKIKG